ncbi:MAG: S-layer homology domain-containing protein [Clostridia bacterium]|nr:S-layer homology domain-containing protein [Clostridia bacterium]
MKKIVSFLLALVMASAVALTLPVSADASELPFRDVKTDDWFYPYVRYAYDNSIMQGKSGTVFGPEDKVTRAEIVTVFYRMAGGWCEYPEQYLTFADVKRTSTEWYAPYVGWAKQAGLIDGYEDKTFRPDNPVTRQELAKLIVSFIRYLRADASSEGTVGAFTDAASFPEWSRGYIEELRSTGLMKGDEKGRFNPEATATRAETATVLTRLYPAVLEAAVPKAPLMGWSAYYAFNMYTTEERVIGQMDAAIERGLADAGYKTFSLDDWWYTTRDGETGRIMIREDMFPHGMKYIADAAHERGLYAGIYTDIGYDTCGSGSDELGNIISGINVGLASGNKKDDLYTYTSVGNYRDGYARSHPADPGVECWGFDYIKIDSNGTNTDGVNASDSHVGTWSIIKQIERETGRDLNRNMCRWLYEGPYQLLVGDSWRSGGDSYPSFKFVTDVVNQMKRYSEYSTPGHYADLDMLMIGHGLTPTEEHSHFAMWCMFSSPLQISCDVRYLSDDQIALLTDPDLIALDQDPLGDCAAYIATVGENTSLWRKKTVTADGGTGALALFNPGDDAEEVTVDLSLVFDGGRAKIRDLSGSADLGEVTSFTASVEPHGALIFRYETDCADAYPNFKSLAYYESIGERLHDNLFDDGFYTVNEISKEDAAAQLSLHPLLRPVLVDVRSAEEYAKGHLPGAVNVPYLEIASHARDLPYLTEGYSVARPIVIYASSREEAEIANYCFKKFKFTVYVLNDTEYTK